MRIRSSAVLIAKGKQRTEGTGRNKRKVSKMGKPKMLGYFKPCVPNSKADQRRSKPFVGVHKKGKVKK
jgi:hypothetical protein